MSLYELPGLNSFPSLLNLLGRFHSDRFLLSRGIIAVSLCPSVQHVSRNPLDINAGIETSAIQVFINR